ncbi:MAG: tetratricopeptide repeat protein [Pseudomonadota bacterium]
MLKDRYENPLTTTSNAASDAYNTGMDRLLAGQAHVVEAFEAAVGHDDGFCLAHVGLARAHHSFAQIPEARAALEQARQVTGGLSTQEQAHLHVLGLLIDGKVRDAYVAIRAHLVDYPRDAIIAQTSSSVFGLIGFSGKPGREAETLAYNAALLPHYGEDWWCLSQYAFALCETGNLDLASEMIDRSLALNPHNAHGAHVRSHVWYEQGETQLGRDYLTDWMGDYDRSAVLHGHLAWHVALWALEQGDTEAMWAAVDRDVAPDVTQALPINTLTDMASILHRAEVAGVEVSADRWRAVSEFATAFFPKPSNAFVDVHAALAHAMAGNGDALAQIIDNPRGPAADLVPDLAVGYREIAAGKWSDALPHFVNAMADHARVGGSRAQRDLLEYSLTACLLKQDKMEEAKRLLAVRRPLLTGALDRMAKAA